MARGWQYRILGLFGAASLTVLAVGTANLQSIQQLVTSVPVVANLTATTLTGQELLTVVSVTIFVVLATLWPMFKPRPRRILDTISMTERRILFAATTLATIGYFDRSLALPRTTLVTTVGLLCVLLPVWFLTVRDGPGTTDRAILVGNDPDRLVRMLGAVKVELLGYIVPPSVREQLRTTGQERTVTTKQTDGGTSILPPFLGDIDRLETILVEYDIDTVYLAFAEADRGQFFDVVATCYEHGVTATVHRDHANSVLVSAFDEDDLVDVDLEPIDWQDQVLKRLFDVAFASIALLVLSPVILCIVLAIKLDSRGPVLYSQDRTAEFGSTFTVYKFRTMYPDSEDATPSADGAPNRITSVGKLLRRTHLDEIPQLWSILTGTMSVVGPRAVWTDEERHIEDETVAWRKRWFIKPGLTGLAQINDASSADPERKLRYDLEYIKRQSLWFDLKIVVRQLWAVGIDAVAVVRNRG